LRERSQASPPKGGRKHPEQSLINVNTRNILFICGGAYEGLEKIIARRINRNSMGFGAAITTKKDFSPDEYLPMVEPDDLLKYGMIPEFVGRIPVVAALHSLDEKALLNILTEPRNALVKQYQKLLRMEGVELQFEPEALTAIVKRAVERGTGARALRSIMEETMLEIMYQLPSRQNVVKCVISRETVTQKMEPTYLFKERRASA
jgi:ATP-dependent Clp protease ATP-binding subunit ClpX